MLRCYTTIQYTAGKQPGHTVRASNRRPHFIQKTILNKDTDTKHLFPTTITHLIFQAFSQISPTAFYL